MQHCTCCVLLVPLQCAVCLPAAHCLPTLTVHFLPVLPDCVCAGGGGVHVGDCRHPALPAARPGRRGVRRCGGLVASRVASTAKSYFGMQQQSAVGNSGRAGGCGGLVASSASWWQPAAAAAAAAVVPGSCRALAGGGGSARHAMALRRLPCPRIPPPEFLHSFFISL